MPLSNDALKQQLASRAHATSSGVAPASGGAPPAGGPQGVFDVSNDGINWHPAVRLTASTGTAFVVTNGEAVLTGQNAGMVEYADHATFRASPAPADGAVFRIISPPGEFRYSSSTGAGWADDDDTLLKPASVNVANNGRAYSTRASEHAATFSAFRAMKGLLGRAKHVHVESHTTFGDGGGGIFDVKAVGSYVDNNGTVLVNGTAAGVRRTDGKGVFGSWFGIDPRSNGTTDYSAARDAAIAAVPNGGRVIFEGDILISTCATISNYIYVCGTGNGHTRDVTKATRFILADGMTGAAFRATAPCKFQDFVIRGKYSGGITNTADGIQLDYGHVICERVSAFYCGRYGFNVGNDTTNANTCTLRDCVSSDNGSDNFHVEHLTGSHADANCILFDHCMSQRAGRHGFYDANWSNTYRDCLSEVNTGWALYIDDNGTLCGGHSIIGGDYAEGSLLGDIYVHPVTRRSRIDVPYSSQARYDLGTTDVPDVGVYRYWLSVCSTPTVYTDFSASLGHEITVYLNRYTCIRHGRKIQLAGGHDAYGSDKYNKDNPSITLRRELIGTEGVWLEVSRSFEVQRDPEAMLRFYAPDTEPHVLLPLRSDVANIGSSGGELQRVSAPVLSRGALEFDGSDDAAFIELVSALPEWTCVARVRCDEAGQVIGVGQSMPGKTTGDKGFAFVRGATYFGLSIVGTGVTDTAVASDGLWHTVVLVHSVTGTTLYIDGTAATAEVAGGTMGTAITFGAEFSSAWANFTQCAVGRVALYPGVASTETREALEDWAENMTGIGCGLGLGFYRFVPADKRLGFHGPARVGTINTVTAPWRCAFSRDGTLAFVTGTADVTRIVTATGATSTVTIGQATRGAACSPDGINMAFGDGASNAIGLMNVATSAVNSLLVGGETSDVCWSPDGRYIYGCSIAKAFLYRFDLIASNATSLALHTAYGMAISPDGHWLYVANYAGNVISVVDTTTFTVLKTIPTGAGPVGVAFEPGGNIAAVANNGTTTVTLIDVPTHAVISTITGVGASPYYLQYSPQGQLVVGLGGEANVARVNRATNAVTKIATAANPNAVAFSQDGMLLYAIARASSKVSIIDKVP